MAEAIRVHVMIIHGPFVETAPTHYSTLQFGNTLLLVATRESNCFDLLAGFFIAA